MSSAKALARRTTTAVLAVLFVCAAALPILISQRTYAAQLTERSIDISTSRVSATDTEYVVSFKVASTTAVLGVVVDFCDSPLVGTVCTAPAGFSINESNLVISGQSGNVSSFTLHANSTDDRVVLTNATGFTPSVGDTVTFTLGSSGANDAPTNPSGVGSFYARILTFSTEAAAHTTYDSSNTTPANNPGPATIDSGGVAMSTANQLTVSARVQEVLTFCVGTTDAATNNDCSDISGTTVDLGVVQSGTPSISPVLATSGGNNTNGLAMVRTNGVNGVVIDYFAEPVTGDSGSVHLGALRVSGATCAGDGTIASGSKTDQCFNSSATTQAVFAAADEGFGMTVSSIDTSNGTTNNITRDVEYDGDGTNGAGNGWAWTQTATDTIASSTASGVKVVDDEMLVLRFAAQAAVTTPTGQYGVTSTYIATSSF